MELSHEQEAELKSVLASHQNGISYADLCEACYSFEDLPDVSRALRTAVNLGIAYKDGKLYYDLDGYNKLRAEPDPSEPVKVKAESKTSKSSVEPSAETVEPAVDPVTEEIKKLLGTNDSTEAESVEPEEPAAKVIQSKMKRTYVAPLQTPDTAKAKVNGNLRRTKNLGAAAMALYKFRNERPLTLDDLSMLIGLPKTALSGVMSKLVDAGYASKSGPVRYPEFSWSDNFAYPFDQYSTEDSSLVLHTVVSWKRQTGQAVETENTAVAAAPATQIVVPDIPVNGTSIQESVRPQNIGLLAVQQVDLEIQMLQQQIEGLLRVRERISSLLQ